MREKLGVTVIVLADDALSQIKAGQERKGYPVTGTTFGALDYVALAKGSASRAATCEPSPSAARRCAARPSDVPTLIAAHVDPSAYQLG